VSAIRDRFDGLRARGERALIPYFTGGFPDSGSSARLIRACVAAGADLVEIGIPFSDPLADGPVIQNAARLALEAGMTPSRCFELCRSVAGPAPVLFMTYYNIVYRRGLARFARDAARAGASGLVVPDLPVEESGELRRALSGCGLDLVQFATPFTPARRLEAIFRACRGFLYCVSVAGVTGERAALPPSLAGWLASVRRRSPVPVAVGFGISSPEQAGTLGPSCDGVIVGSLLMKRVADGRADEVPGIIRAFKRALSLKRLRRKRERRGGRRPAGGAGRRPSPRRWRF